MTVKHLPEPPHKHFWYVPEQNKYVGEITVELRRKLLFGSKKVDSETFTNIGLADSFPLFVEGVEQLGADRILDRLVNN